MRPPRVSVVVPVWKPHRRYFRAAVKSVLAQTFAAFELVLVEDPSPVGCAELLEGISDQRIRYVRRAQRISLGAALNDGVAAAVAPLIARFDADDLCEPDRLERQVAFLEAHPEVDVYGSRIVIIDENDRAIARRLLPLTHEDIVAALRRYNCLSHPSVMFRRDAFERVGGYDSAEPIEDYDLWCRMMRSGARFSNAVDSLIRYRLHPGALKYDRIHEVVRHTIEIKQRYFSDRFNSGDRLRIVGERLLLFVPPRIVLRLFTRLAYRAIS